MTARTRHEVMDMEWRMERDQAETVPCPEPGCEAATGHTCRRITDGGPLDRLPAHHRRITAARQDPRNPEGDPNA